MIVRTKDGKTHDSRYDDRILRISIVAPGVLICTKNEEDEQTRENSTRTFYPWSEIEFVMDQWYKFGSMHAMESEEFEHPLEQFYHLT